MQEFTVSMVYEKSTKGTHRYTEVGDLSIHKIGTLYVKKHAFKDGMGPLEITVSVEQVK